MRRFRYVVADVFTDRPLAGNQLAVFTDARDLDPLTMQALAREMNFAESVFVLPPTLPDADVRIRIFTPWNELPFAGHPVLGAAFVLGEPLQRIVIRIETGAGVIPVELEREGARVRFGWMEQPLPEFSPFAETRELFALLGVERSGLPVERSTLGPGFVYVELGSAAELVALRPDFAGLAALTTAGAYCFSGEGRAFKARVFVPAHGVPEDAATGSGAGPLAVHLLRNGRIGSGEEIEITQGVEIGRPSLLYALVEGAPDALERVRVGGCAVPVARGSFTLP
jgi:trans-2,3-dihydro-3-hydroxyanthranilate isomerase